MDFSQFESLASSPVHRWHSNVSKNVRDKFVRDILLSFYVTRKAYKAQRGILNWDFFTDPKAQAFISYTQRIENAAYSRATTKDKYMKDMKGQMNTMESDLKRQVTAKLTAISLGRENDYQNNLQNNQANNQANNLGLNNQLEPQGHFSQEGRKRARRYQEINRPDRRRAPRPGSRAENQTQSNPRSFLDVLANPRYGWENLAEPESGSQTRPDILPDPGHQPEPVPGNQSEANPRLNPENPTDTANQDIIEVESGSQTRVDPRPNPDTGNQDIIDLEPGSQTQANPRPNPDANGNQDIIDLEPGSQTQANPRPNPDVGNQDIIDLEPGNQTQAHNRPNPDAGNQDIIDLEPVNQTQDDPRPIPDSGNQDIDAVEPVNQTQDDSRPVRNTRTGALDRRFGPRPGTRCIPLARARQRLITQRPAANPRPNPETLTESRPHTITQSVSRPNSQLVPVTDDQINSLLSYLPQEVWSSDLDLSNRNLQRSQSLDPRPSTSSGYVDILAPSTSSVALSRSVSDMPRGGKQIHMSDSENPEEETNDEVFSVSTSRPLEPSGSLNPIPQSITSTESEASKYQANTAAAKNCLEELLDSCWQCTICSEVMIQSVVLNCGHSFCEECIEDWKNTKGKQNVPCPNCRTVIVAQFPNHLVNQSIESTVDKYFSETAKVDWVFMTIDRKRKKEQRLATTPVEPKKLRILHPDPDPSVPIIIIN